jgi:Fe-S-cluster-containing dehydrogenase component
MSDVTRRLLLKSIGGALGLAALAKALAPLRSDGEEITVEGFLRKSYRDLSPEEIQSLTAHLEEMTRRVHGVDVTIRDAPPIPDVEYGYALNLSVCTGCQACVEACHRENNHDRPSAESYIRVLEMTQGSLDLAQSTTTYDHPVPAPGKFYMPVQCMQCRNPPCVRACPVGATWQQSDGITVTDYNWCIGCRYCEVACPYHARRFNWTAPEIPAEEINPDQALLANTLRPRGVDEKCHFCLHRVRDGRLPACLEACPTGARVFGNLNDPRSEICRVLEEKRTFTLREEAGTAPRFFYFFED